MIRLPASLRPLFVAAGWHPGRRVAVSPAVAADHPARAILAEFGGLRVGRAAPGGSGADECAKSDVAFRQGQDEGVRRVWEELLGTQLIGMAEAHNGHEGLYVDGDNRVFGASIVHDAFYFHGALFEEAMERLLSGRRAQPMLRPDQDRVVLYGDEFTADHPAIYRYR
jgi:hypothetical protein